MAITPMTQFIHGVQLKEMFYREAVAPILLAAFPGLRYSAALIGYGSDVLGYDSIDQFADSTNLLMWSDLRIRLRLLFETAIPKSG